MMNYTQQLLTILILLMGSLTFAQHKSGFEKVKKQAFVIGETISFESKILGENRSVNVYLPSTYHPDSLGKYPVIYLLDGSQDEDIIHVAGLVQFGSFSWIRMLPESIVVGIANVDRKRDFTYPTTVKEEKEQFPTTGESMKFIRFIKEELQALIASEYGTASTRTIIGQSLGGLLASEILLKEPDLFDNYIIISPSLWWDNESLLEWEPRESTLEKKIFIGCGKEGEVMERVSKMLYEKVVSWDRNNIEVYYEFFKDRDHGDVLHLALYSAFEKLFKEDNK